MAFSLPYDRIQKSVRLRRCGQAGQGSAEFIVAVVPILLLGLGSIEAVHWYFARQAVSLALVQAARAAATQHADPHVLDASFAHALLPLMAGPDTATARARLAHRMARREHATGLPAWNIRILSPAESTFADFQSRNPDLPDASGTPVIDNDYLHEQHEARMAQGWADGRGALSGQTTLEANTLVLHLTWLHEPLLPGVRQLMRQLAPHDARYGSVAMRRGGYLPLRREVAMVMQSHALASQLPVHGRITRNRHPSDPEPAQTVSPHPSQQPVGSPPPRLFPDLPVDFSLPSATRDAQACTGLWCLRDISGSTFGSGSRPGSGDTSGGLGDARADSSDAEHHVPESGTAEQNADQRGADPGADTDDAALRPEPPGAGLTEPLDDCPGCC